ncbi:DnaJ sub A member 2 [Dimargaris verticillata]|uniref:DnaJ sub A member 2 n=1 Tax=Dimargaris verticillata TaxID=2761393 RepID=A0A9W8B5Y7_9FUNG|nr:DnaJ sub A member 2 [Dimargaris verticillata]
MGRDFYEILEVEREVDAPRLKKAYRQLAMRYHPDKNPEGADKFKEVQHAYEILSDPERRAVYDEFGEEGLNAGHSGAEGFGFDDLFSAMFNGSEPYGQPEFGFPFDPYGAGPRGAPRSRSKETAHELEVDLTDLYLGKTFRMGIEKSIVCQACTGTGSRTGRTFKCKPCKGAGFTMGARQLAPGLTQRIQVLCQTCHGEGRVIRKKDLCRKCHGEKTVSARKVLHVEVKPGMKTGERIVLSGEGDQAPDQPTPDLVFVLKAKAHPVFTRRGNDLLATVSINLAEALTGFSRPLVTHLDGRQLVVTQAPGEIICPGAVKCIYGEGMPVPGRDHIKGALYLQFQVDFPLSHWLPSDQQYAALRALLPNPTVSSSAAENPANVTLANVAAGSNPFAAHSAPGASGYMDEQDDSAWTDDDDPHPSEVQCNQQ